MNTYFLVVSLINKILLSFAIISVVESRTNKLTRNKGTLRGAFYMEKMPDRGEVSWRMMKT